MALKLLITDSKGQTANYHRVIVQSQVYEGENQGIHINLAGYTNATFRQSEKDTGENMIVMNTPIFLPFNATSLNQANIYTRIKAEITQFIPSTDI